MPLPHVVARFNTRATNRAIEPLIRRLSGYAIVSHTGRRTGRPHTTPVYLFTIEDGALVVLTYGPVADWCQNVLATGGTVTTGNEIKTIGSAVVVDRRTAWPVLPRAVRLWLRIINVHQFLRLTLVTPEAGSPQPNW